MSKPNTGSRAFFVVVVVVVIVVVVVFSVYTFGRAG